MMCCMMSSTSSALLSAVKSLALALSCKHLGLNSSGKCSFVPLQWKQAGPCSLGLSFIPSCSSALASCVGSSGWILLQSEGPEAPSCKGDLNAASS